MVHLVYSSRLTLRVMPSIIGRIYHPELDLERKSSELGDGPMAPTSASPLFHCLYGLYDIFSLTTGITTYNSPTYETVINLGNYEHL